MSPAHRVDVGRDAGSQVSRRSDPFPVEGARDRVAIRLTGETPPATAPEAEEISEEG